MSPGVVLLLNPKIQKHHHEKNFNGGGFEKYLVDFNVFYPPPWRCHWDFQASKEMQEPQVGHRHWHKQTLDQVVLGQRLSWWAWTV